MAARRPLVLDASNRTRELPVDDMLIGVPLQVAVGLRAGGAFNVALTSTYKRRPNGAPDPVDPQPVVGSY